MIVSAKEIRRTLGKKAKKYSDEQIEEVIGTATVLSDLMLDFFIERERKAKLDRQEADKKGTKG
jgi:uncharacterized protein YbcI